MKKLTLFLVSIAIYQTLFAQKNSISAIAGLCFNGTGDSKGLIYSTEFSKYFKAKYFWSASFGGTIHDGSFPIFFEYPVGRMNDGSVNYTIAGFQSSFHIGKNFRSQSKNELYLKLGTVLRYQSSSYWDTFDVLYSPLTGLPFPVIVFDNSTPRETIAIGASIQIGYSYVLSNNYTIGLVGGFQFDTQGDNLSNLSIKFGKRF